jgi:hypothetical protein
VLVERAYPNKPKDANAVEAERWFSVMMHKALIARDSKQFDGDVNALAVVESIKPTVAAKVEESKE